MPQPTHRSPQPPAKPASESDHYEAPRIESVMTAEDLARAVQYAPRSLPRC
jgi:hypothetical protein